MAFFRRPRARRLESRRLISVALIVLAIISFLALFIGENGLFRLLRDSMDSSDEIPSVADSCVNLDLKKVPKLPKQTEQSLFLEKMNQLPPRNTDLFPNLPKRHVKVVLYVHNRPEYFKIVVDSLSKVEGIQETLLIVSHDGFFEEMDRIVKNIRFCQVKQIYAPFSPHLFPQSFPGFTPGDCAEKDSSQKNCRGDPDQYGNHRSPKIVSLKHHWWWMMNTVWDGLRETKEFNGHILFIEEDHFILPNAYRSIELLIKLKSRKCPECCAANLAPSDVTSKGEGGERLIAEKIGNVGYAFNRTIWRRIHSKTREFCRFDDYNWDITMWSTVYPSFGSPVYTLRGPRTSAVHFGKCGLHQGQGNGAACVDNGVVKIEVEKMDKRVIIQPSWDVHYVRNQGGYAEGFKGWGGWGDSRDHDLCMSFALMYKNHSSSTLC
ncbi:beta-1,2-N-acetylglucosaminyltransferase II [Wolffia australiana]